MLLRLRLRGLLIYMDKFPLIPHSFKYEKNLKKFLKKDKKRVDGRIVMWYYVFVQRGEGRNLEETWTLREIPPEA